jgi:hypothetical protein
MTTMQKIKEIEDEMARTQKNKATSGHLGMLKVEKLALCPQLVSPTVFISVVQQNRACWKEELAGCLFGLLAWPYGFDYIHSSAYF